MSIRGLLATGPVRRCLSILALALVLSAVSGVRPVGAATADENFIAAVHRDFLLREPTLDELAWWSAYLSSNSQASTVAAILDGAEFEFLWVAGVNYHYFGFFDSEGALVPGQVADLASTGSFVGTELAALQSADYFSRSGGTNTTFVTEVYRDVLGRAPDPAGLAFWVDRLDTTSSTRRQVANHFIRTTDSARLRVAGPASMVTCSHVDLDELNAVEAGSYCIVLDRMAGATEASYWVNQMTGTGELPTLWAQMAGSAEYYNNAQ